ncbi:putative acetylesterase [Lyophyllum shimeji]|uniref:Acetylesterase n=1 Tax=Lyophyllum shimeji TaxID=47721 RepID=A0A9P3US41_LYOSH|nr:putative acetylesterase [Lyophyllum shimeji]
MFSSLAVSLLVATLAAAAPGILTIGDSTVTDDAGWGKGFCADTTGLARCINLAVSGTTTVSWQSQPQYSSMLTECKNANTYATIQFGHNDQKVMDTATFASNLESLTNKIKTAGCSPILVTSLCRRTFSGSTLTDILGPYSNQTVAIAKKLDLPVLPLLADCMTYIQKLGKPNAMQFNLDYPNNTDTTHLNAMGSRYFGRMVADEVKKNVPALTGNIVADPVLSAKIAAGTL